MRTIVRTDDGALDDVRNSMNFDIIYKDVTGSTNDDVWDLANHGAHPASRCARCARNRAAANGKRVHG